jgi:nucleoside-diphosphate-sugar epimerase
VKIVLTGCAGFIGSHYFEKAQQDSTVLGFDRTLGQDVEQIELPDCDAVVHMAATNGTQLFYRHPTEILINDSRATFKIVERYKNSNTKIVFTSSCEIFNGAIDLGIYNIPTDESVPVVFDDILNPRWSYSLPKAMGENLIANCGSPWLIIRYFNVYGPRQTNHFINEFVERVKQGKYYINGDDTRSFCYIDDAVEITHRLVKNHTNTIVNVGNSKEYQISDVAKEILKIMNVSSDRLEIRDGPKGSVRRRCPDTTRLTELTKFENYTDLKAGLIKTIESML